MDPVFQSILDNLPSKPAAPLEPYRELILEMRRRGQTYREIARVLAENFQVETELAAIHDFVRPRAPRKPRAVPKVRVKIRDQASGILQRRVEPVRDRPSAAGGAPAFDYDENEPLRIMTNTKRGE